MPGHVTAGDTAGACDQPIAPALMRTDPAKNHGDAWLGVFFMSTIMYTNNNALHVKDAPELEHFHFIISFVF